MARYIYHLFVNEEFRAAFTSINKLLNGIDVPMAKKLEIGRFYRQDYFEKSEMKTYVDNEFPIRIEVKILH